MNVKVRAARDDGHPILALPREDLDLIMELVLHSGSLKALASSYDVSYPTIRLRLDRLIERLRDARAGRQPNPLNELLARLVERSELNPTSAREIQHVATELIERARTGEAP